MRISDWSSDVCSSDLLGARITWRWWHDDAPESASGVEITLVPVDGGTRVPVVEQPLAPTGAAGASAKASVRTGRETGRASCRERVCQYVSFSVFAGALKKTNVTYDHQAQRSHH